MVLLSFFPPHATCKRKSKFKNKKFECKQMRQKRFRECKKFRKIRRLQVNVGHVITFIPKENSLGVIPFWNLTTYSYSIHFGSSEKRGEKKYLPLQFLPITNKLLSKSLIFHLHFSFQDSFYCRKAFKGPP